MRIRKKKYLEEVARGDRRRIPEAVGLGRRRFLVLQVKCWEEKRRPLLSFKLQIGFLVSLMFACSKYNFTAPDNKLIIKDFVTQEVELRIQSTFKITYITPKLISLPRLHQTRDKGSILGE